MTMLNHLLQGLRRNRGLDEGYATLQPEPQGTGPKFLRARTMYQGAISEFETEVAGLRRHAAEMAGIQPSERTSMAIMIRNYDSARMTYEKMLAIVEKLARFQGLVVDKHGVGGRRVTNAEDALMIVLGKARRR